MPVEWEQRALVGPVVGAGDEALADGVCADVFPFFGEVFASTDLRVPALALPEGAGMRERERPGGEGFPVVHPAVEVGDGEASGGAEEVDVVRHDHVAGDEPVLGVAPGVEEAVYGGWVVEDALAVVGVDGDEKEDGAVVEGFVDGVAGGAVAGGECGVFRSGHAGRMTYIGTDVQLFSFGGSEEGGPGSVRAVREAREWGETTANHGDWASFGERED